MKQILLLFTILLTNLKLSGQINLKLSLISKNFNKISNITNSGDDRMFVVEQTGKIRIVKFGGEIQASPFLDLESKVLFAGEMGLLGLAFHPQFKTNGYFFINYIDKNQKTVLARYRVSQTDSTVADTSTATTLITFAQPYSNHNGGDLHFGPDGYLYISSGDGGSGGDPQDRGQNLTTFLGKILRIDVDSGQPYSIPAGNLFADGPGGNIDEIWSYGLRNPWRFSFDHQTGDMWIADVGQNAYEEINLEPAGSTGGKNYGWRCYEGNHSYNLLNCTDINTITFPVFEYSHSEGCSVTGGFVYRGTQFPVLQGRYLYADFCAGKIWSLRYDAGNWINELLFQDVSARITTFGESKYGELFIGDLNGKLYQICELNSIVSQPDLVLNSNPILPKIYFSDGKIFSSGSVNPYTSVSVNAFRAIFLEPGFRAESGAVFVANVGVCGRW